MQVIQLRGEGASAKLHELCNATKTLPVIPTGQVGTSTRGKATHVYHGLTGYARTRLPPKAQKRICYGSAVVGARFYPSDGRKGQS